MNFLSLACCAALPFSIAASINSPRALIFNLATIFNGLLPFASFLLGDDCNKCDLSIDWSSLASLSTSSPFGSSWLSSWCTLVAVSIVIGGSVACQVSRTASKSSKKGQSCLPATDVCCASRIFFYLVFNFFILSLHCSAVFLNPVLSTHHFFQKLTCFPSLTTGEPGFPH